MPYVTANSLHPTFAAKFRTYSKIFSELGARLETPSADGYIWRLVHGERAIVFLSSSFPMNSASAGLLALDKLATYQILGALGIKIPRGFAFFAPMHDGKPTQMEERFHLSNLERAVRSEFPEESIEAGLIVKPGTDSGGRGVRLGCGIPEIIERAAAALAHSHFGLVQEFVPGGEYRVAILDGEILAAYRKRNPFLRGDGVSQIGKLLQTFCAGLAGKSAIDAEKMKLLTGKSLNLDAVPADGEEFELELETQNLSQGAWPELLEELPPPIWDIALKSHHALGLNYSGIDLKFDPSDGSVCVLEVNANPGFAFLERFQPAAGGAVQRRIARRLLTVAN